MGQSNVEQAFGEKGILHLAGKLTVLKQNEKSFFALFHKNYIILDCVLL